MNKKVSNSVFTLFLSVRFFSYIGLLFLLLQTAIVYGQDPSEGRRGSRIINDSTKQVYGPKTSKYFYEEDVFLNLPTTHFIDTAIRNFHRFNYVQRFENLYQDLGNVGTAIRPIYYTTPETIGVTSGFTAYDLYWSEEKIKYYDTKSPYSNMKVVLGGKGRSITRVTYSRNVNQQLNFGFNFRGLFIDKQIGRASKGDRNVRSNYYDFYTAYHTKKDSTYMVFFNFQRANHQADESGGVNYLGSTFDYDLDYFAADASNLLTEASSNEKRINVHLFHQYKVGKALQVYHIFDRYRQGERFNERPSMEGTYEYDHYELPSDTVSDRVKFKTVRNEVGIKGNLLKLFYNGYYAIRDYSMDYSNIDERDSLELKTQGLEHYLGGRMALRLDSIGEVSARAELLQTGNYRIEGQIKSKWFEASIKQMQYDPSFVQQAYRGAFDVWAPNHRNNSFVFDNVNVTELKGALHYRSKVFSISPGFTFTRIGNYVFFKEDNYPNQPQSVLPVQTSGEQVFALPEIRLELVLARHIFIRGHGIYGKVLKNSADAIQIPELFGNGQLAYENIFFNGNLDMHAGVDVHFKSTYAPLAYDVPTQQYYVQSTSNQFKAYDYTLIDIFFNARIKRGRIFVKYNNLMQAITKRGYFPTPNYPGQRSVIDFGFDWSFYD